MHKITTALHLLRNPHRFWTVLVIRLSWCKPLMALLFFWTDCKYSGAERRAQKKGQLPIPPAKLRFRISNNLSRTAFIQTGRQSNQTIKDSLKMAGTDLGNFACILDFGCGCGRMARGLIKDAPNTEFHGTDVDVEAIAWCQNHLETGHFSVNQLHPPLAYPDATFDLIYSNSIFTHIDEESGLLWLMEFHRLLKDGGYVIFTVHGESVWQRLSPQNIAHLQQHGFLFIEPHLAETDGAFHTRDYIERITATNFELLSYTERAMANYQDVAVLRKR